MQTLPQITEIELSPELQAELDAIPDRLSGAQMVWTDRQAKLLLAGWGKKTQENMAKLVGHCEASCRTKYKELSDES